MIPLFKRNSWAKTINVFRACLGAQLTICAQNWRNFVLFSTVSLTFVLSRVCVFLYSLGPLTPDPDHLRGGPSRAHNTSCVKNMKPIGGFGVDKQTDRHNALPSDPLSGSEGRYSQNVKTNIGPFMIQVKYDMRVSPETSAELMMPIILRTQLTN